MWLTLGITAYGEGRPRPVIIIIIIIIIINSFVCLFIRVSYVESE